MEPSKVVIRGALTRLENMSTKGEPRVLMYCTYVLTASTAMVGFYELQLLILVSACLFCLLVDRYASSTRRAPAKDHDPDRLENGGSTTPVNALATLTRRYLVVYAIVMGASLVRFRRVNPLFATHHSSLFRRRGTAIH